MHTCYVRTRVIKYTDFEPNTMLLSSKNFVRTKMHLKVWAAVCHPDFIFLFRSFEISKDIQSV